MTKVNAEPHGIHWNFTQRLDDLAHDICLLALAKTDKELKLRQLGQ